MGQLAVAATMAAAVSCGHADSAPPEQPVAELAPDAPWVPACDAAPVLTVVDLHRDAPKYEGARIAIDAVPVLQLACGSADCACCNECVGSYRVNYWLASSIAGVETSWNGDSLHLSGIVPDCSGLTCELDCRPFGRKPTHKYRFVGTFRTVHPVGNRAALDVEVFCRAANPATTVFPL